MLIAAGCTYSAIAQKSTTIHNTVKKYDDASLGRWTIDANLKGGSFTQNLAAQGTEANYLNGVNLNIPNPAFSNGGQLGGDLQLGFFVGEQRHWGIGTGLMYTRQWGDLTMQNYHAEYQSTDYQGHTFRQLVSSGAVRETIKTDNFSIPLLAKYKTRFSKRWGFAAEAGPLFNISMKSRYNTNATFDYEAIYQLTSNPAGNPTYTYDPSPVPADRDWLITRNHFIKNNSEGNPQDYFNGLRSQGYNVGLGVQPDRSTGTVTSRGSVGFLVQPSVNYFFSDDVALNVGAYYSYMPYTTANDGYRLTDKTGEYNSLVNASRRSETQSFGANVGLRFFFGKMKDSDHDGVADKKDKCPDVFGLPQFDGCPDTDKDGVQDSRDSCVDVPGLIQFHGCPDTDGDGIPDRLDACPYQAGPREFHGCPDTDHDGIPDKDDLCPTVPGLREFQGCPDTDGDGVPDNKDKCPAIAGPADNMGCPLDTVKISTWHGNLPVDDAGISTPILFHVNKATIHPSSYPILQKAAAAMKNNQDMRIVVDGHTDITGPVAFNNSLSQKRANAVRSYLIKLGADPKRLKAVGHGSRKPIASNKTKEGRSKNRRAVMKPKTD